MLFMDMPNVPPQYAPIVIAQAAQTQPQAPVGGAQVDRTIGVCQLIENLPLPPLTAVNALGPITSVWGYLQRVERLTPAQLTDEMFNTAKASILQQAKHGTLVDEGGEEDNYRYDPNPDYLGTDRATILVEMGGYRIKVVYHFKVMGPGIGGTDGYDPYMQKENCPKGPMWKISTTQGANGSLVVNSVGYQSAIIDVGATTTDTAALASTLGSNILSTLSVDPSRVASY